MAPAGRVNVLLVSARDGWADRVRAVDPDRLLVHEVSGADLAEEGDTLYPSRWPQRGPSGSGADAGRLLREAEVILLGLPYPSRLYTRTGRLGWVHHPNAGASNLWDSDLWGAPVTVTSSRGSNYALPIAETVLAGAMTLARGLHIRTMRRADFAGNVVLSGKTMGIVGLGGIGGHVARMAKGMGMSVLASRLSATDRMRNVGPVDEVLPASLLHELLGRSDVVAICVMLTKQTEGLFDADAFAAMKPGAILVNVARGEVVHEHALMASLEAGRLGGAYLDVYAGELHGEPPPDRLLTHPAVIMTPHISGVADETGAVGFDLFLEYLRDYLAGKPLDNVIDWDRGY